jgi:hypothetical protein
MALLCGIAKNCSMSVALATADRFSATTSNDRRPADRLKVETNAELTVLSTDVSFDGWLINVSDGGAQIRVDRKVAVSELVKIECADFFLLGEVVCCEADREQWMVGVNVEHGLYGLKALAEAIRRSWLD